MTDFSLGVVYLDFALSAADGLSRFGLSSVRPSRKPGILEFAIQEVPFWDKEHFYFQAPGGQVFRLVGKTEDMSRWQR